MSFYYAQKPFEPYGKVLIEHVNISIEDGEHVVIIGNNGVGKTSLLEKIYATYSDEAYYMEQDLTNYRELTAMDYIISLNPVLYQIRTKMSDDLNALAKYIELDGYGFEQKIVTQAKQFKITEDSLAKPLKQLSGGEQTRIAIIRAILSRQTMLLLDEPTNHLDDNMVNDLCRFINNSTQTIIMISHHRGFINNVATHIIDVNNKGTTKYEGSYDDYKAISDLAIKSQNNAYIKQQQQIKQLEKNIQRVKQWHASSSAQTSVRDPIGQKKLSKLIKRAKTKETQTQHLIENKNVTKPTSNNIAQIKLNNGQQFNNRNLFQFQQVCYQNEQGTIFDHVDITMKKGENVLLTGPNGSGKSMLVKLITGLVQPTSGKINISPSLEIAYFDQQNYNLNFELTPMEMLLELPNMTRSSAQTILNAFNFDHDSLFNKISNLSMGEKSRLQFVLLYFAQPHLLILDEPTNYFDIHTQELIMEMLKEFGGQVLLITHDEYLKSKFDATQWYIKNRKIINSALKPKLDDDVDSTLSLLEDFKHIDEFGHYQTDD
ncbi:ABC-F family ATP-binding cassette domain-containing protein [Staphylococcus sp. 18_1_E_LY]|uniref:ABC-F family ATP-binding cassette domain-containing protein n=1 Tax=Staphylococcus lloydii TaxID=2781774 RepID=A0A7T1B212_9STAP|nr:Sal family ABC-F type ribosomal protection protein [Staphylococcus lloydii]MBF7018527.1 ABC-F family ATP-binding cassette domain-containing protein [Staphylococcus lloydii]MBF7026255.1 ABC-F family ATP-binding cassette domain-containing protein [Staphylococcus lloydii]QPM76274.1 ABC-F family ATP-binding cassette domain-containing protein [Staphylococcus lloydii]